jgi:chromosome segregation ATPase
MVQMIINILLVLSVLLNAYFALKLEQEVKEARRLADKRLENVNDSLGRLSLAANTAEERMNGLNEKLAAVKEENILLRDKLADLERQIAELPITAMEEEAERMKAFNDGISEIMSFNPDVPKLNKDGLRHG